MVLDLSLALGNLVLQMTKVALFSTIAFIVWRPSSRIRALAYHLAQGAQFVFTQLPQWDQECSVQRRRTRSRFDPQQYRQLQDPRAQLRECLYYQNQLR